MAKPPLQFRSLGHAAALACSLEAAAPKVGNVHRGADFADLSLYDFLLSAQLLGDAVDRHAFGSIGELVRESVAATRAQLRSNSNLGIALLFAPIVKAYREGELSSCAVLDVIEASTERDCQLIYDAIKIAQPGGLGEASEHDVAKSAAPEHILEAMNAARERDLIARQYCSGFADLFDFAVPNLVAESARYGSLVRAIISTHLRLMARLGDSLVERKCGLEIAGQLQTRAAAIVETIETVGWTQSESLLGDFDFWLRSDSNRRNPGATADLIAATLLIAILSGQLSWIVSDA